MKHIFGREKIINKIKKAIEMFTYDETEIFQLYGEPGVGKTAIVKEVQKELSERKSFLYTYIDLNICSNDCFTIVNKLYRSLKDDISFPLYEMVLTELENSVFDNKDYEEECDFIEKSVNDIVSSIAPKLFAGLSISKRALSALSKTLSNKANKASELEEYINIIDEIKMSCAKCDNIIAKCFVNDLNNYVADEGIGIVIIVENYNDNNIDLLNVENMEWFKRYFFYQSKGIFWLITGNKELNIQKENDNLSFWTKSVNRFSDNDSCEYIQNGHTKYMHPIIAMAEVEYNINDKEIQDYIKRSCKGIPGIAVAMFEHYNSLYKDGSVSVKDFEIDLSNKNTFSIFMKKHYLNVFKEGELKIIEFLSVYNSWNKDIYEKLNRQYNFVDNVNFFDELVEKVALVERNSDKTAYWFTKLARDYLIGQLEQQNSAAAYREAYLYYSAKVNEALENPSFENINIIIENASYAITTGSYSCQTKEDFIEFSMWYKRIEQQYTVLGLYSQKVRIILDYISYVNKLDLKRYDDNSTYYFMSLYDLAWAYRYLGDYGISYDVFSSYYTSLLKDYSVEDPRLSELLYSMGIAFYSLNKISNAKLFLNWAIDVASKQDKPEYQSYSYNALGYIDIFEDNFEAAETNLETSLAIYSDEKHAVKIFANYSKLFFLKAWKYNDIGSYEAAKEKQKEFENLLCKSPTRNLDELCLKNEKICFNVEEALLKNSENIAEVLNESINDLIKLSDEIKKSEDTIILYINVLNNVGVLYSFLNDKAASLKNLKNAQRNARVKYKDFLDRPIIKIIETNINLVENNRGINCYAEYSLTF